MNYFVVFQNKTYERESRDGILWAPKRNKNNTAIFHWSNMTKVKPGDVVFSIFNNRIVSVNVATSSAYDAVMPAEFSSHGWDEDGWKVDLEYKTVDNPIKVMEVSEGLAPLLDTYRSPFQKTGRGNQGYLFELPHKAAEYLLGLLKIDPTATSAKVEELKKESDKVENFKMEKWVITCNPKYYDVVGAFNALDSIHWKQSVDIKVGDIVYIYVGKPLGTIKYETKAMAVNLPSPIIDDTKYVIDATNYENYGRYMELKLLSKFEDYLLPYNLLKDNGLKSVQGPSRVSDELEELILDRTNPATIAELEELKKESDELEGITGLGADKEAIVKARIGHGKFKKALLRRQDHCQICGLDLEGLLIASHIKPWSKSDTNEKVDPENGLLLCPNHDALFDKGLISFTDDGDLLLSFVVDPNAKGKLDLKNTLKLNMSPKRKEYMSWHRDNLFKSNNKVTG